MPKKCIKFISEFLVPSLNEERFGDRLKWLDKEKEIFQMDWYHKGGPRWTEREAEVFVEWDKHKGHYHPEEKMYFTQSKQRFRALLYKLTSQKQIIQHNSTNKFIKIYSIGEKKIKRRKRSSLSSASDSSEYEIAEPIHQEICDTIDSEGEYRRRVSDDSTKNILEDHSYTSVGYKSGIEKDHAMFRLMGIPDLTFVQESTDSSSENVPNYLFNNLNNSLVSMQDSTNDPAEKMLVKVKCPYNERNNHLTSLQESNNPSEKMIVKRNCTYEQNHFLYSLQEPKVLVKRNNPYNELNSNLSLSNADLFSVPTDIPYEETNSSQNVILKVQDDLNNNPSKTMYTNLWKYSKENEVPSDDPLIAWNYTISQDMGLITESASLPMPVFTSTDLDLDYFYY